ncbi:MAG: hypothetical protein Q8P59_07775 [Dehalococcoidia bacterium]|nr:hypothetical protein [Dehalococcoidia bacterium]
MVEYPLALSHTEVDSVVLFKMVRQQQAIPEVLVVPQISGGATYFVSQPVLIRRREPAGAARALALPESGKAIGQEPVDPIFNGPGRVLVQEGSFVGAGSLEHVEHHMKPMEVSPFSAVSDLILNGRDKGLRIWNNDPFHWQHPLLRFAPSILQWLIMRNYLWRLI